MRFKHNQSAACRRGGALFWLLLCLGAIFGFLAILMDGGRMMEERRRAQAGADAAALAAAYHLFEAFPSDGATAARDGALAIARENGYANDGVASKVTVNVPPKSGPFTGKADCVEVLIESTLPAGFGKVLTGKALLVKARAVARGRPSRTGLLVLKSSGAATFKNTSLLFTLVGSSVVVNSNDPAALETQGIITAKSFEATGGIANSGLMLGKQRTGVPPTADPLRYLSFPDPAPMPIRSAARMTVNSLLLPTILQPGVYKGGIRIIGLSIVILQPGTYVLEGGGLEISGAATVTGTGVLFRNTAGAFAAGPININSLGNIAITAPGAGMYRGINVLQDRNITQPISVTGNGLTVVSGLIYAPAAPVNLRGLLAVGLDTLGGAYICDTCTVSGIGGINLDLGNNLPQIPEVNLVD